MSFQKFFPFSPAYSTWEDWNGNLIVFYGQETIPHNSEVNWKDTASSLALLPTFQVFPVPAPETFDNWQDWANEFTQIVNGPSR